MDIQTLFNLNGRVALVTGGSRGIGKMIVEGYLKAGAARVYISARKIDQIEETVAEFGDKVIGRSAARLPDGAVPAPMARFASTGAWCITSAT